MPNSHLVYLSNKGLKQPLVMRQAIWEAFVFISFYISVFVLYDSSLVQTKA